MHQLIPVSMRLELVQALNHSSFINDTYNSDLGSLETALDFLERQQQHPRKTVIVSDILQTGPEQEALYGTDAGLLRDAGVDRCIDIGKERGRQWDKYLQLGLEFLTTSDDLTRVCNKTTFENKER